MRPAWSKDLFEAILTADEDDDAPRLVYADWLTERGDARGELIVIQIRLARGETSEELYDRESMLLTRHNRVWLREAGVATTGTGTFRRGFLETLSIGSKAFLKATDRLAATSILRDLTFSLVAPSDVAAIAGAAVLGRVTALRFQAALKLGAQDAVRLAEEGAPNLGRIRELAFARHPITKVGVAALVDCLPQLRRLDVADCAIDGLEHVTLDQLEHFEAIDLSHNPIAGDELDRLCAIAPNLVELRLWGTELTLRHIKVLVERLPRLRRLAVGRANIGTREKITALGALPLEELVLAGNPLDTSAMQALVDARPLMQTLTALDISSTTIGASGLEAIARAAPPRLVDLRAKGSGISTESIEALSESPLTQQLEVLSLSDNEDFGDDEAIFLSHPEWPQLKSLELYGLRELSGDARRALRRRFGERLAWSQ